MTANLIFRFIQALNPKVNVRSRSALTRRIIPLLHRNLKETMDKLLVEEMPHCSGASFTSDIWSSRGQHSYLSLTMHFIDQNWKLHRFLIDCRHLEDLSHTGDVIGEKIDRMIEAINLPGDATVSMVTDAGTNMVKAMRESPIVTNHLICVGHIISNCLKDAFDVPMIRDSIEKLKDLAACSHRSIQRTVHLRRACNELKSKFTSFHGFTVHIMVLKVLPISQSNNL